MEPHWNGGENDMENEKRALSWREFVESGFDGREYQFPDFEGLLQRRSPVNAGIGTKTCWHILISMTEERS